MRRIIVHIGIHKTGTTAIQHLCARRAEDLSAAGVLFSSTGFLRQSSLSDGGGTPGHAAVAKAFERVSDPSVADNGEDYRLLKELANEYEQGSYRSILISSERFSKPSEAGYEGGLQYFAERGYEITVIGYLRRQDAWLESFYRQRIQSRSRLRETRTLREWYDAEGSEWLDYRTRLGSWLTSRYVSRLLLRSFDDIRHTSSILGDFLSLIDVPVNSDVSHRTEQMHNPSVPGELVDLVRGYNSVALECKCADKEQFNSALATAFYHFVERSTLIDDPLWEQLKLRYAALNESMIRDFISGPSDEFVFPITRDPVPAAKQFLHYDDARRLFLSLAGAQDGPRLSTRLANRLRGSIHQTLSFLPCARQRIRRIIGL